MSDFDDELDAALDMREPPGIGDNNPPDPIATIDPERLIDPTVIVGVLERNYPDLHSRHEELLAGAQRWIESHTPEEGAAPAIADDEDAGATGDLRKMIASFAGTTGEVEEVRKRVKAPVFEAGKKIDGWFNDRLKADLLEMDWKIGVAASAYIDARAARIRQATLEAARKANEEAARLAAQAERARSEEARDALLSRAVDAEEQAATALAQSERPIDAKVRSDLGTVTFYRSNWKFEVVDLKALAAAVVAGTVAANWLVPNESAINASIKGKNGLRDVPGLRIYDAGRALTR